MPFKKGESGNPNGRSKGTPNKINLKLKGAIEKLVNDNMKLLESDFKSLEPKDRLTLLSKLLPFVMPKLTSEAPVFDFTNMSEEDIEIIHNLIEKKILEQSEN